LPIRSRYRAFAVYLSFVPPRSRLEPALSSSYLALKVTSSIRTVLADDQTLAFATDFDFSIRTLLTGVAGSAKSSLIRVLASSHDLVIVPTRQLRNSWKSLTSATVVTLDLAIRNLNRSSYRFVFIDEVFMIDSAHVARISKLAGYTKVICLGDPSQIGLIDPESLWLHQFDPSFFNIGSVCHITHSFSMPRDALGIAIASSFVDSTATTSNPIAASIYVNADPRLVPEPDNLFDTICFSQAHAQLHANSLNRQLSSHIITIHASQGSRYTHLNWSHNSQDSSIAFCPGHVYVALSRHSELLIITHSAPLPSELYQRNPIFHHDIPVIPSDIHAIFNPPYVADAVAHGLVAVLTPVISRPTPFASALQHSPIIVTPPPVRICHVCHSETTDYRIVTVFGWPSARCNRHFL